MPDNWSFVVAAYGLTAFVLLAYWRRLVRKERELRDARTKTRGAERGFAGTTTPVAERSVPGATTAGTPPSVAERSGAGATTAGTTPSVAERSQEPSRTVHPRLKRDGDSSLP